MAGEGVAVGGVRVGIAVGVGVGTGVFVATGIGVGSAVAVGGTAVGVAVAVGTGVAVGEGVAVGTGDGVGAGAGVGTDVAVGNGVALGAAVGVGEDFAAGLGTTSIGVAVAIGAGALVVVGPRTTGARVGSGSLAGVQARATEVATAIISNSRRPEWVRFTGFSITTSEATWFSFPSHWEFRATNWCNAEILNAVFEACTGDPSQISPRKCSVGGTLRDQATRGSPLPWCTPRGWHLCSATARTPCARRILQGP